MRGRPRKPQVTPGRKLWVDADTCPAPIMGIMFRIADRQRMTLTLVASESQQWPNSSYIRSVVIPAGISTPAQRITEMLGSGDLVITRDSALAQQVIIKQAVALHPNGELHSRLSAEESAKPAAAHSKGKSETVHQRDQLMFTSQVEKVLAIVPPPPLASLSAA